MEKPKKLNFDDAAQGVPDPSSSLQPGGQETFASHAERPGDVAATHPGKYKAAGKKELARSLESVRELPRKFSRSYLVPFTEHLLELDKKRYTLRDMLRWLQQEHGVKSNLSTLSYFLGKARQEEQRAKKAQRTEDTLRSDKMTPASGHGQSSPIYEPLSPGRQSAAEAREAIRTVKKKAKTTRSKHQPIFTFDQHKPLISNQQHKSH